MDHFNQADNTEQRIFDAAVKVFVEKGYDGARLQEIADQAGINKSLLHYYYRNKELLFKKVFANTVATMFESISSVLNENIAFETKIKVFCSTYITFLEQRPQLPLFLLNEIRLHPQLIAETMNDLKLKSRFLMLKSLIHKSVENKEIEAASELHLMLNVISMLIFPVIGKNMISLLLDLSPEQYTALLAERKTYVPEFILQSIQQK